LILSQVPLSLSHRFPAKTDWLLEAVRYIPSNAIHAYPIAMRSNDRDRLIRGEIEVASPAYLDRDERIVEFRHEPANCYEQHGHVGDDEADYVAWVVAYGVEGRVREAEDYG
jgi:hypothetical protein